MVMPVPDVATACSSSPANADDFAKSPIDQYKQYTSERLIKAKGMLASLSASIYSASRAQINQSPTLAAFLLTILVLGIVPIVAFVLFAVASTFATLLIAIASVLAVEGTLLFSAFGFLAVCLAAITIATSFVFFWSLLAYRAFRMAFPTAKKLHK